VIDASQIAAVPTSAVDSLSVASGYHLVAICSVTVLPGADLR
jgi:hypothetical protein